MTNPVYQIDVRKAAENNLWEKIVQYTVSDAPNESLTIANGTAINPQADLAVNGNILGNQIKVKTDISVPDYVFEPDYKLKSLEEIESYVKENKHLPEIPTAKQIQADGLDVAEMNLLLLKKMEEMTLHLIDQQKQIREMKAEIDKKNGKTIDHKKVCLIKRIKSN